MNEDRDRSQEVFEKVLCGDLTLEDHEASLLSEEQKSELRELLAFQRWIEPGVAQEREALQELSQDERRRATGRRWSGVFSITVIAAGILLMIQGLMRDPTPEPEGEWEPVGTYLAHEKVSITLESPLGETESLEEFRWTGERPEGFYFRVLVWEYDAPGERMRRVLVSELLESNQWRPEKKIPSHLFWQVELCDFSGAPRAASRRIEVKASN